MRARTLWSTGLTLLLLWGAHPAAAAGTRLYLSGLGSAQIMEVNADTGQPVYTWWTDDSAGVVGSVISPDGRRLYVVDGDSRVRVIDTTTAQVLKTANFSDRALAYGGNGSVGLTGDGKLLIIRTYDYAWQTPGVLVFDTETGRFDKSKLQGATLPPLVNGGDQLFAVGDNEVVSVGTTAANGPVIHRVPVVLPVGWTATARHDALYVLGSPDDTWNLMVWRANAARPQTVDLFPLLAPQQDPKDKPVQLAVPPDQSWVAVAHYRTVWFLDPASLQVRNTVTLQHHVQNTVAASDGRTLYVVEHGRLLAVSPQDGSIRDISPLPGLRSAAPIDVSSAALAAPTPPAKKK